MNKLFRMNVLFFLAIFSAYSFANIEVLDSPESVQQFSEEQKRLELNLGFSTVEFRSALLRLLDSTQIDWNVVESDLSDSDLKLLFDSLFNISFYNVDHAEPVRQMYKAFEITERRELLSRNMIYRMYEAAFVSRQIDIANEINSKYLFNPPFVIEDRTASLRSDSRTLLINGDNTYSVIRKSLSDRDHWFVLFFLPGCGVAMQVLEEMVSQPDLLSALSDHGLLLIPQYEVYDGNWLADWRSVWPVQTGWMYSFSEWPEINDWYSPSYYVSEENSSALVQIQSKTDFFAYLREHFVAEN